DAPAQARLLQRIAQEVLEVLGVYVDVAGSFPAQPALLVANHVSWLDPFVIMAHVPCLPVAKSEVSSWPVVGRIAQASGVHFVRRDSALSGARLVRTIAETLSGGTSVLNFPEGTTTDGGSLLPFRPGAFRAARAAGVPVAPVALSYRCEGMAWTGDASFLPHYLGLLAREGCPVRLQFGDVLHARSVTELELSRRAHRAVAAGLREVRDGAAVGA
ncbi:MAG TPA: lysophospholipid acyltransferase family protein, partial [Myxococcales bacterium]|nr:lysophospholipid acyltransferase family protein [Myxococcales bacterium]